ncbi:AtpZ/AtpI family protein [Mangrovivirga sp. M17]|uniref:AtpZ/AtpI family protein n=1 Tax=Mangrovivirga halotolerans TaxID=2993936 RepID=A0ABT3RWD7_9BACT|nr:AtpZ/AtpI family protein [Mangrovivirga halotolerans]MCX2745935.1 AtpZ/AtpI family protein [Mangrovivirga halotolerans]
MEKPHQQTNKTEQSQENKKPQQQDNSYLKYSQLAIQMAVTIGLLTAAGYWADKKLELETPWLTLAGAMLGTIGVLYQLYSQIKNN